MTLPTNPSYDPDHQVPCTAAFEFITPELAKEMLGAGNRKNRRLNDRQVTRLRGIMDRDEWMYDSTDAIGVATDGAVVNGQHRCETIAASDRGVWCLVTRGVRPSIINVIDQGASRNFTQTLQIDGHYADPQGVSGAVEWAYKMIGHFEKQLPLEHKPSVPQLLDWLAAHPRIVDSLEPAKRVKTKLPMTKVGMLTGYHYAFSCVDAQLADDFFEQLATGLGIGDSDPVYTLRERLIKDQSLPNDKQLRAWQIAVLLVTAWEAARAGEKIPAKAFAKAPVTATQVPTVTGVEWLGTTITITDVTDDGNQPE
jgi:hypothetical protein